MKNEETIKAMTKEVTRLNQLNSRRKELWVGWEPPPVDWISLNTEGSSRRHLGMGGGGGVFRDRRGPWLGGFAKKLGVCLSVRAELRAVLRRLLLATEKGFQKLVVNVDSSVVVDMLQGNILCNAMYEAIAHRCKSLIGTLD